MPSGFDALLLAEAPQVRLPLPWLLDIEIDRFELDDSLVAAHPEAFILRREWRGDGPVDPRSPGPAAGEARARLHSDEAAKLVRGSIVERLQAFLDAGASGFRLHRPDCADPDWLEGLLGELRGRRADLILVAQSVGVEREAALRLRGFDALVSSFSFWDRRSHWLAEEYESLRRVAPLVAEVTGEAARRAGTAAEAERLLRLAAIAGHGMIVPAELAARAPDATRAALELAEVARRFPGEMRLFPAGNRATAIVRGDSPDMRDADEAMLVLVNRSLAQATLPHESEILAASGAEFQPFRRRRSSLPAFAPLGEAEVRALFAKRAKPICVGRLSKPAGAREAAQRPRLVIERISPDVDEGRFPVKRTVGDVVEVEAVFFGDGHEQLAAELRWRAADEKAWRSARMEEKGNDRWTAAFPLERLGRYEYQVEGWLDVFGTFRRDFIKKRDAGVALPVEFLEGRRLVEAALPHEPRLQAFLAALDEAEDEDSAAAILLDPELQLLIDEKDVRRFAIACTPRRVEAERLAARFSSWYELFPRSQSDRPDRHGTFDDVVARLPQIREMGFDTLYFPPIHPIGRKHRKGRNNSLDPGPDDPGSPYAIGGEEGGHDAVHPELGTLDDFRRLVAEARVHGLEIALDFAIQCSPDHPWLREHPGWFDWRPDGTIKYAENPPKKYQDIVNVDFWKAESIPDLWLALRDVVLFWIGEGVKTFRVDNPHTKAFPFWEWMIGEVRGLHPDVIFLSEAFTRPAIMYRLAKIGFSQSYTYFTWRNGKQELADYLTELTTTEVADFFRPHFFVNTPDINPIFLHTSGRAGFRIRACLAATLSGLFGVYSGFELCESEPVPGKEEYWESEKYEIKPRDWQAPGNIIADITLLNRLRRAYPALQTHLNVSFFNAWNDNILYYGKRAPDGSEMILVAVSLDPHNAQECDFELPLWEFGLADHDGLDVEDLVRGGRFQWNGKIQHLRLDPDQPYAIWRVAPPGSAA
ncbi:alpha-1,4-glucan--maltose-1-phosphate maltosyltransferase [Sphingosinicella terrae]|uniref:alpha-1,4-glucan--maltose-1-phosphate maltosyltransferase n=1 Tax=Sphingosinicella terrae TaxID=2172047 RepID=UPI000E0CC940|nr:alpha-1,4-glucan--maltose-1-phosphate maltosyltransferase [Sphingosinicella terrae]